VTVTIGVTLIVNGHAWVITEGLIGASEEALDLRIFATFVAN